MDDRDVDIVPPGAADSSDDRDVDIPPLGAANPSDDPGEDLDIPELDNTANGPSDSGTGIDTRVDSQTAGGSAAAGNDQEDIPPELQNHVAFTIDLPQLQTAQQYIDLLRSASLDSSAMQAEDIEDLRNPGQDYTLMDPSPLLRSVRHFINNYAASREHYETMRNIERLHRPDDPMLSFDQVKRRVRWLSGVVPVEHDMCVNSCLAFTGPREGLDACPRCKGPRYSPGTTKPQKRFSTIPMGPVIQAMYSSRTVAESMHYLERKLADNVDRRTRLGGDMLDFYDDTASGQALLDAWTAGHIGRGDVALQFSIDGAQLRADRPSEAWFFIWVIHNLPPTMRYKKTFIIPGAIVPGPSKPWDIDSFMFPSLYHIAALQREGLRIYDASLNAMVQSRPLVILGTADSPGSAFMSGMVGHSGRVGCRLYCDMPSRRRMHDGHYYPAMNRPHNYDVEGCSHPDVSDEDLDAFQKSLPRKYKDNLDCLLAGSTTLTDYRALRLVLGLCKQTLFSGLPCQPLSVPSLFTMDIMHLSVLNDPDLFLKLFTGKLDVYEPDDRAEWDWAIFYRKPKLWSTHGETVPRSVPFIPSSFGRAPRDPSKRLNSGYKAWEFQIYVYGLCPTLLRHLLPRKYWLHFCKLVAGIRIMQRPRISKEELLLGHELLRSFAREFEDLYYQRKESRIHFVRQSIHLLTHIAPETIRVGPLACYAQWTLETAIGNLGREIRQDRDLFANLAQRAVLRAQTISLKARFPDIQLECGKIDAVTRPTRARKFEGYDGFAFLPRCEDYPSPITGDERDALKIYWRAQKWPNVDTWPHAVCRWAKLQLPNGQKARSIWQESSLATKPRRASCVEVSPSLCINHCAANISIQVSYNKTIRIANVLYYFCLRFGNVRYPLAMVELFSEPDVEVLSESSGTVYLCDPRESIAVLSIKSVHSVVAMFPDMQADPSGNISLTGKFSLIRHPYIEVAQFTDDQTFEDEEEIVV